MDRKAARAVGSHVREVTREAFSAEGDAAKLDALSVLPGFATQEAIPTALLCAYDPIDYGVMDQRALYALNRWESGVGAHPGMTLRYLARVRAIRGHLRDERDGVTARDVDKGLFVLGADRAEA